MSLGDTLKRFTLADNFILNTLGNLVGIKNPNANGADLRVDQMPQILAQSAVPIVLPSSGSANGSGVITHTTALPYQPAGVVLVYLPAGVVTGGSQGSGAGVYQATYSSTSVCQIAGTGITTTAGAYTQTTAIDLTLASIPVPPGSMGINGVIRESRTFSTPSNANNKSLRISLGGSVLGAVTSTVTATTGGVLTSLTRNRGSQASQVTSSGATAVGAGPSYSTIDMSAPQNLAILGQLAVATDYLIIEGYSVEILPVLQ